VGGGQRGHLQGRRREAPSIVTISSCSCLVRRHGVVFCPECAAGCALQSRSTCLRIMKIEAGSAAPGLSAKLTATLCLLKSRVHPHVAVLVGGEVDGFTCTRLKTSDWAVCRRGTG
jgi:hypothetical protein